MGGSGGCNEKETGPFKELKECHSGSIEMKSKRSQEQKSYFIVVLVRKVGREIGMVH